MKPRFSRLSGRTSHGPKTNLECAFGTFGEAWSPRIVGSVNGVDVRIAKFRGESVWHFHEHEDEFFFVIEGRLLLRLRDGEVRLGVGDFIVVPRGVEHLPVAESEECRILTVSPGTLMNTGNVDNERTVRNPVRLAGRG